MRFFPHQNDVGDAALGHGIHIPDRAAHRRLRNRNNISEKWLRFAAEQAAVSELRAVGSCRRHHRDLVGRQDASWMRKVCSAGVGPAYDSSEAGARLCPRPVCLLALKSTPQTIYGALFISGTKDHIVVGDDPLEDTARRARAHTVSMEASGKSLYFCAQSDRLGCGCTPTETRFQISTVRAAVARELAILVALPDPSAPCPK